MRLFDKDPDPDCLRPKNYSEGEFAFLSVSSRPICRSIVGALEKLFSAYPDGQKKDALKREIETSDEDFNPAFFELLLFQFFNSSAASKSIFLK